MSRWYTPWAPALLNASCPRLRNIAPSVRGVLPLTSASAVKQWLYTPAFLSHVPQGKAGLNGWEVCGDMLESLQAVLCSFLSKYCTGIAYCPVVGVPVSPWSTFLCSQNSKSNCAEKSTCVCVCISMGEKIKKYRVYRVRPEGLSLTVTSPR